MHPGWSLRARLTVLSAALLAVALTVGAFALSGVVSASRVSALDAVARDRAVLVANLARTDRLPDVLPVAEPGEIAQLLGQDGEVLATSANASRTLPLVPPGELRRLAADAPASPDVLVRTTDRSTYDDEARVAVVPVTWQGRDAVAVASVPLREVQGVLRALHLSLIGVVPVLTAVLAAVIWVVIGRALRPVDEMRRAADEVARSGGPGALPIPRHDDEIAALARTLNDMLDRLRAAEARQRAFVADAAHELRSPVAALRTAVDVALAYPEAYTAAELARESADEVARLQALVDDLLALARLGARPPQLREVDLAEVARGVVAGADVGGTGGTAGGDVGDAGGGAVVAGDVPGEAGGRPVEIVVTGDGTAVGDPSAVARIVRNLVENAVRYAASTVAVTVGDGVVVVDDDGPGIAPEDRERVFERFTRLDASRDRGVGGTGLGLAIARETAREGGGDVGLETSPSGGLRARLTLPLPTPRRAGG